MEYLENIDDMNPQEVDDMHEEYCNKRASLNQKITFMEKVVADHKAKYNGCLADKQISFDKIMNCLTLLGIVFFINVMLFVILPELGLGGVLYGMLEIVVPPILGVVELICSLALIKRTYLYITHFGVGEFFAKRGRKSYLKASLIRQTEQDMVKYALQLDNLKIELAKVEETIDYLERKRNISTKEDPWER